MLQYLRPILLGVLLATAPVARQAPAQEAARLQTTVDGHRIDVFVYRPQGCAAPSLLLVFHGNGRGARSYLESARDIADRGCFVVYAPLFDRDRFPNWSYHRGGIVHDGEFRSEDDWTTDIVDDIVDWARLQEDRPEADSFLFGHSAGGQFLSRVAAYDLPDDVDRIIIANPSTYVLPNLDEAAPYGFGGLPDEKAEEWMRAYLAAPVTIFLGSDDTGNEDLTMNRQAVRQGKNRVDRGQRTFEAAKQAAARRGWPFNWQLVYAQGVGHSGRGMLTANELTEAMGF